MYKIIVPLLALGCAACAAQSAPQPDPEALELLLAQLEQQPEPAPAPDLLDESKRAQAERLLPTLEKLSPSTAQGLVR